MYYDIFVLLYATNSMCCQRRVKLTSTPSTAAAAAAAAADSDSNDDDADAAAVPTILVDEPASDYDDNDDNVDLDEQSEVDTGSCSLSVLWC